MTRRALSKFRHGNDVLRRPQLNSKLKSVVLKLGEEKTPIIIIDNFLADTSTIVNFVCDSKCLEVEKQTYYPGVRAEIADSYSQFVIDVTASQLFSPYQIPLHFKPKLDGAYYSLVTTSPDALLPEQSKPHIDSVSPFYLAILHYLSPAPHGGTGFFKHKETGFEKITSDRKVIYSDYVSKAAKPKQGYITQSSDQYELIGEVAYKENRVVIYPGNLLHSGLIDPLMDINMNPREGRLTANFFLDFISP